MSLNFIRKQNRRNRKMKKHLTILIRLSFILRSCCLTDFSSISDIVLPIAKNIILTASEQQTGLTSTPHPAVSFPQYCNLFRKFWARIWDGTTFNYWD